MRRILIIPLLLAAQLLAAQGGKSSLQVWSPTAAVEEGKDWFITGTKAKAALYRSQDNKELILDNGLIKRVFRLKPNLACVAFSNLISGEQLIRAVSPEAIITINGKKYNIGGLQGQPKHAYLKDKWLDAMSSDQKDFKFVSYDLAELQPYINYKVTSRWSMNKQQTRGKVLNLLFKSDQPELLGVEVTIHYELYDGLPLICKWLSVINKSRKNINLDKVTNEVLATPEEESSVVGTPDQMKKPHGLYVESNYAFNNATNPRLSDQTSHWKPDSRYDTQVNYGSNTPCLLEVYPPIGPGVELTPGRSFQSIRTHELLFDSYDRERNGLVQRRMYRTIAPWVTENPIFMHLISSDPVVVKKTIDQCVTTGYEGVILSFGSGLDMEDISAANINKVKEMVAYAHSRNILLGCYSLFSSRQISDEEDVVDPLTGKPDVNAMYGHAPCLAGKWGLNYIQKIQQFLKATHMDIFENDGPYAGDLCASTKHPGHKGVWDSQWAQMELQKGLYRWCSENGIYVNAPDWYIQDGANKMPLGYRETNFSLSRDQQIILNRQNIYDGLWEKTPSMGWGFVPLTEYQGGGAAATLEPLSDHLYAYEQLMMQYYGSGEQACYRGPRLYDTDATKKLVIDVISWYKKHRVILNSDIVHLKRADGLNWDGILHVNKDAEEKGLAMLYNPLDEEITRRIRLPLYYTGLAKKALITNKNGKTEIVSLDQKGNAYVDVKIPANSYTWLIVKNA
jgi:hypothetical protein